jgi:Zn-dependent metalloprotease
MSEMVDLVRAVAVDGKQRNVFTANNGSSLPGTLARTEGDPPTGDLAVDEAYDGSGTTFDLFKQEYERDSIDGRGMRLDSTVHYQVGYDNAFWNGRQMVYGDGDEDLPESQRLFNRFTIALDIIGHELTHGVTQFEAGLVYRDQSGALNESFSDVFGSLVKQKLRGQTAAQADWIIGEGLFTPNVNGVGIRSMKAPGTAYNDPVIGSDPQPAHMSDYKNVDYDNGGVHINSGIPNHAFYATAMELGGFAWEKAGRIWYITLRDRLTSTSVFTEAAQQTYLVAGSLYGKGSLEQQAVKAGWSAVGIPIDEADDGGDGGGNGGGSGDGCATVLLQVIDAVRAMIEPKNG